MLAVIILTLLFNITYTHNMERNLLISPVGGPGVIGVENNVANNQNVQNQNSNLPAPEAKKTIGVKVPASDVEHNPEEKTKSKEEQHQNQEKLENNHVSDDTDKKKTENTDTIRGASNEKTSSKQSDAKEHKSSTLKPQSIPKNVKEDMQSGALLRGFYVFVGLSVVIMVYFVFRSYRLRRGSQPSTTVRKYGVTARRSDMEMRPLELDDDDDDTLFEIGSGRNTIR